MSTIPQTRKYLFLTLRARQSLNGKFTKTGVFVAPPHCARAIARQATAKPTLATGSTGSGATLARFVIYFLIPGGPMTPTGRHRR